MKLVKTLGLIFDMFCYSAFALIWWGCWSVGVGRI
jgi:hypothetical protein